MLGAMWKPADIDQFEAAVESGMLEERHDFDAKRQLPSNNKELAKDLAAMSTDGGSLIYGVGEDDNGQPRLLAAIELDGAGERIDQVAEQSISGSLRVEFVHLRRPDQPGTGYLMVVIPASPEAPHQVTVGEDRRFYRRSDTGNRKLSEPEVARLYERRAAHGRDRDDQLDEWIASAPAPGHGDSRVGFLHAFAAPALPDDELWDRAVKARGEEQVLLKELRDAAASASLARWGGVDLTSPANWTRRGAETWSLERPELEPGRTVPRPAIRADLSMDGRAYLLQGDAAGMEQRHPGEPLFVLYGRGIALTLAQFMALAGALYEAGGLYGPVDVGMAVTGIEGAVSAHSLGDRFFAGSPYGEDSARRTERCDARDLRERPQAVSQRLLARLFSASFGRDFDPLAED
jgi:hypothetical protein